MAKKAAIAWTAAGIFLLLFQSCTTTASATLGQAESGVLQDLGPLSVEKSEPGTGRGYRFIQLSSKDLVVKEYINPGTTVVFGVTWNGARMPDLGRILGFDPAKLQAPGAYRSLHHTRIRTPTLVLEIAGRMGFYIGRAVRIDLLPSGVSESEVAP